MSPDIASTESDNGMKKFPCRRISFFDRSGNSRHRCTRQRAAREGFQRGMLLSPAGGKTGSPLPLSVSAHLHLLREQHAERQLVRRPRSFTRFVEIRQHEAAIEGIIRRL